MRKILVPMDGSENALRALRYAAALAKEIPIELHVLNVQEPMELLTHAYLHQDRIEGILAEEAESELRPARELLDRAGLPYIAEWRTGDVAPAIDRHARDTGCDAIIMGTRGMSALGNLTLGSIATKVVHLVEVPVTLVK